MRKDSLILSILLLALVIAPVNAQDSVKFGEPICIGYGASPRWSPDGSMLAYVTAGSLYVTTPPEFKKPKLIAADIAPYQWVANTGFVWKKRIRRRHEDGQWYCSYIYLSDLTGNVELLDSDSSRSGSRRFCRIGKLMPSINGTIRYHEVLDGDRHNTRPKILRQPAILKRTPPTGVPQRMAFSRPGAGSAGSFGDIWLADLDGSNQRQVTHGPDTWLWALLSPNQELIATTNHRGQVIILDTLGNTLGNAGGAEVGGWSPNSNMLLVFVMEDDGHKIFASELLAYDIGSDYLIQLTTTPELIEEQPVWSPDGKFIAYVATNTRQLFIMPVEGVEDAKQPVAHQHGGF